MIRVLDIIHKATGIASVLSLVAMITCVIIQVGSRFLLDSAPSWTEELSRIFFIYSVALGIGLAFRDGSIIKLDLLSRWLSVTIVRCVNVVIQLTMALFGLYLLIYAIDFFESGFREKSPALQISMTWSFAAIPILFLLVVIFSAEDIIRNLKQDKV